MKKLLIALFLFPVTLVVAVPSAKPRLGEAPVRKIVAAMSLEEKAGLLVGTSMEGYAGEGAVTGRTLKTVPGSAGTTRSLDSDNGDGRRSCGPSYRSGTCRRCTDLFLYGFSDRHDARLDLGRGGY